MAFIRSGLLLFIFLCSFSKTFALTLPKDTARLNYTNVYFEENILPQAVEYELFLFKDPAGANTRVEGYNSKNKLPFFWVSDLEWNTSYSWQIKAYDKNHTEISPGNTHKFNIIKSISYRHEKLKLDIKTNKEAKHAGGLISLDYSRTFFDRQGKEVWTLPNIEGIIDDGTQVRDLQLTADNTITLLTGKMAVEIDLNGNVLWKAPTPYVLNNDSVIYHHDFRKTTRGTYMILGARTIYRKLTGNFQKEPVKRKNEIKVIDSVTYKSVRIDVLLEFNKEGKVIWMWDADKYIKDADLNYKKTKEGYPNFSTHANAFSENKAGTKVYIGFRDLNRIIKFDKKTGIVELTYGQKYPSGDARFANGLFRSQHDANVSEHNSIFIFNNNGPRGEDGVSSILELKDNVTPQDCVLIWKFDLDFDTLTDGKSANQGNVVELPNTNLLLCAGALNRVFEVTKSKEIVWDAFVLSKQKNGKDWEAFPQYRCHWMPQLTEYHFIPTLSPAVSSGGITKLDVTITNSGNAEDSYLVEVYDGNKMIYKTKQFTVKKGETLPQQVSFKSSLKTKVLSVKISSVHSSEINQMEIKF